jgi:hypothetical protein
MRKFYDAAMRGHIVAQLGYMLVMGNALQVVTHSTADFFTSLIHIAVFTLPVLAWARISAAPGAAPAAGMRQRGLPKMVSPV